MAIGCVILSSIQKKMNNLELSKSALIKALDSKEIVAETIAQIRKDLGMFGFDLSSNQNQETTYDYLLTQLTKIVRRLFHEDKQKLFPILYRIDITEKDIALAGTKLPDYDLQEIVADQIIMRELKKVIIRRYYKA